jgi:sugar lactone lactonase YvrE
MKQLPHPGPKYIAFIVTLFLLLNCKVHSQIISTIAGNGSGIYNGDSIPATQAQFLPQAIATDRMGNLFISDLDNSRVRRIDVNGIITTIAGNGARGFSGDGGLAINASLNYNWGIALDSSLNLYIVDDGESRIRKVTTDGIINTIAGIDTVNDGGYNGDSILAINARFEHPSCIALDTIGNIYIADQGRRIRKINIDGVITTIAGTGVSGYSGDGGLAINAKIGDPIGIVADKMGNIYFTDIENNVIRKVDKDDIITTVAGNGVAGYTGDSGLATLASLNSPFGLAVSNDGTLFIADTYNHAVRKVDTMNIITTIIGDGSPGFSGDGELAKNAKLNLPVGLAFDGNNLLIADYGNARIRKVTSSVVLAIVLISFNASYNSDGTIINWQTASEINAAYFNIQRSKDGKSFTKIGKLAATGKSSGISNYQFIDEGTKNLEDDILYYRLQSIDKNGSSNYSKTATVILKNIHPITLYPNPVNDILNVKASSNKQEAAIIQITDLQGKVLKQVHVQLYIGSNSFRIDVAALAKGSYIIEIKGVTTKQYKQFVKS